MNGDPQELIFLDTNILVYAYDTSAGQKHDLAGQLLKDCWESNCGCVSIQILQEFFVTVTRKIISPLTHVTARDIVADLTQWRLHIPNADDLLQAINFQSDHQLSFWDAMVVHSANRLRCKQLLSEDLQHGFVYGGVRVINPFIEE